MVRTFVLDTCVLLAGPHASLRFDEHQVVLPLVVVEELDRMKSRPDEVGTNPRPPFECSRTLLRPNTTA